MINQKISIKELTKSEAIKTAIGTINDYTCTERINGILTKESREVIHKIPYFDFEKENFDSNNIYFSEIRLYCEGREILLQDVETKLVCLSNEEIEYIINNLNIDFSEYVPYEIKDSYSIPNDFFTLKISNIY